MKARALLGSWLGAALLAGCTSVLGDDFSFDGSAGASGASAGSGGTAGSTAAGAAGTTAAGAGGAAGTTTAGAAGDAGAAGTTAAGSAGAAGATTAGAAGSAGATTAGSGGSAGATTAGSGGSAGGSTTCLLRADATGASPKIGFDLPKVTSFPGAKARVARGRLVASPTSPVSSYSVFGHTGLASGAPEANVAAVMQLLDDQLAPTVDPVAVWSTSAPTARVDPLERGAGMVWFLSPNESSPGTFKTPGNAGMAGSDETLIAWDGATTGTAIAKLRNLSTKEMPPIAATQDQAWVAGDVQPAFKQALGLAACPAIAATFPLGVGGGPPAARCVFNKGTGVVRAVMGLDDMGALLIVEPTGTMPFDLGLGEHPVNGHLWAVRLDSQRTSVLETDLQMTEFEDLRAGESNTAWITARAVGVLPNEASPVNAPPCADRPYVAARLSPFNMKFSHAVSFGYPVRVLASNSQNELLVAFVGFGSGVELADGLTNAAPVMVTRVHPAGALLWVQTLSSSAGISFPSGAASFDGAKLAAVIETETAITIGTANVDPGSALLVFSP